MLSGKQLDKTVPIPLYFQLKKLILEEIENGNYPVGSTIPTENELSEMFSISRTTVRQAIKELVQEGRLYRIKSKGTFVAKVKIRQEFMNKLQSYNDEIKGSGREPSTEVIAMEVVNTPDIVKDAVGDAFPQKSIYIYRKRCADGEPIVRVKTYLPYDRCAYVLDHNLTVESLYNVLSTDEETRIYRVQREIEAIPAGKDDISVLNMKRGQPVQFCKTFGYNSQNEMMEYSEAYYRGDQSKFNVEIVVDSI